MHFNTSWLFSSASQAKASAGDFKNCAPESQFGFSDMQKAFFKVLRFAAHWPSAEWN